MAVSFTSSFKQQAVEKALSRNLGVGLESLANELGVGYSTLQRWVRESSAAMPLGAANTRHPGEQMTTAKRPQDWRAEEKLSVVIACGALDDLGISALCREKGIYPHHIAQWKAEFVEGASGKDKADGRAQARQLKDENRALKKELRRKESALTDLSRASCPKMA